MVTRIVKIALFTALALSIHGLAYAQSEEPRSDSKAKIKPYGFIRNYLVFDSRRTATVCGGDYHLIPYDEDWNITEAEEAALLASGTLIPDDYTLRHDRNAIPQTHFQALSSRFGLELSGPWNAGVRSNGRLEADFAGFGTTNTVLRLRLAYLRLDWDKEKSSHTLLAGQDWHPLSGDIMPEVLGMAAGSPFRPHSRTPQLRYEMSHGLLRLTAAALYQYQYTSPGPNGESTEYAKQGIWPEIFVGIGLRNEKIYAQIGADYTSLALRRTTPVAVATDGSTISALSKQRCNAISPTLYFQYTSGFFSAKMRSTLAQNLGHLNMLSGYAMVVDAVDASKIGYKPLTASVSYLNLAYGKRWRANLLLGYHKNMGLGKDYIIAGGPASGNIYMKKGITNINSIYRVAPSFSYNTKAFNIGLEYEWTAVTYGDLQPDGTVANNDNLHQVANHRLCALIKYNF